MKDAVGVLFPPGAVSGSSTASWELELPVEGCAVEGMTIGDVGVWRGLFAGGV
jgi:hypothetical protein